MSSLPPEDLLPVLVADLADEDARSVLEDAASSGERIFVPLESAPVSAAEHVLEVAVPGVAEPLTFLATPLGPPTDEGFPLRLRHMGDAPTPAPTPAPAGEGAAPVQAARQDSLVGAALAGGKLVIEGLIGRGGVGAVYRARHRELKMPLAVKVLHESFQHDIDFCRRFYAEALAASRLDHKNVTRVIDFGQEPTGQLYLAMEYLDGVELRVLLEQTKTLPISRIVDIMTQVCAGLSHAHARGIVHRDIKPENLVLVPSQDDEGEATEIVKVCDFGIAQQRGPGQAAGAVPQGIIAGTPEYMSPEQCRGEELDARSDLYSCGVVLYEMATGQLPFTGAHAHVILEKHKSTPVLPPSKIEARVPPLLERIILKALAKDPRERYANMRELRSALRDLTSTDASPPPSSVRTFTTPELRLATPLPPKPPPRAPSSWSLPAQGPWLDRAPASSLGSVAGHPGDELADVVARDPTQWMRDLARITDPSALAQTTQRLELAIRALAARGDVRTLWTLTNLLQSMAAQGGRASGALGEQAARVLRVLADPSVLALVGAQLLTATGEPREQAKRILVQAGVAGAYGLYGARVKLAAKPQVRGPFVTSLAEFGAKAWPVVRAALEKIVASEPNAATMALAEDLLLCVPQVGDEQAGHVVVKYLRVNVSPVCRAATAAIVKLWGERAKPLLIGMLQSKDDVVRIAGIAGLRQLAAIDEHVVPRLSGILTRRIEASEEVRAAAALALGHANAGGRAPAISLLTQLLAPAPAPGASAAGGGGGPGEDGVVLALARSLMSLGGPRSREVVSARAERASDPLRLQLRRLLSG